MILNPFELDETEQEPENDDATDNERGIEKTR